jgi:LPXTG-site transpeptidase (sortase) family protein
MKHTTNSDFESFMHDDDNDDSDETVRHGHAKDADTSGMSRREIRMSRKRTGAGWQALGIVAEVLFTFAVICGLYVVWQMWWTGVEAEHAQNQTLKSVSWSDPGKGGSTAIAQPRKGDAPKQSGTFKEGDLLAQIYIPRFGEQWQRNVVQGTDLAQLNKHGLGHYLDTQMPGQIGNFAAAGHRNGYGQPLGDVDKLQAGDPIVIRTKDYWYVYTYTTHEIVLPADVQVIAPNPDHPGQAATKRMITLTTCEPKYSTPTHRWISYGTLKYWAKVSDGIPKELAATSTTGAVRFVNNESPSLASKLSSLLPVIIAALVAYAVVFIAAAVAWRWPVLRAIREGGRRRPDASIYGALARLQPGVAPVRVALLLLLFVTAAAALFQWGFPWAAANIGFLRQMSNYVAV